MQALDQWEASAIVPIQMPQMLQLAARDWGLYTFNVLEKSLLSEIPTKNKRIFKPIKVTYKLGLSSAKLRKSFAEQNYDQAFLFSV